MNSDGDKLQKEESRLKIKKLAFETGSGKFLEWFKAAGAVIVALGVIGTLALTIYQQRQNRLSRDDDRFDRSVSRVGSAQIAERLTGVAGLQQFLDSDADHARSALLYLVNAVAIEPDPTVRSAMLDTFDSLQRLSLSTEALNGALASAIDRNRALFKRFKSRPWSATKEKPSYNTEFPELAMDPISEQEKEQLLSTAGVMAALVRAGARVDDLSNTFCMNCDFSAANRKVNLSRVKFDWAMLRGAKFFDVNLDEASFHNADLLAADFTKASLRKAKLTVDLQMIPYGLQAAYATGDLMNVRGVTFACSDLTEADFSGRTTFGLILDDPIFGGYKADEFFAADLHAANFIGSQFFVAVPQSGSSGAQPSQQLGPLSPVDSRTLGSGPSDAVHYVNGKYVVWTFSISDDTSFSVPLKSGYRRSLILLLSSFGFAKHLSEAKLPSAIAQYVEQNKAVLDKPVTSYDCKGGKSFDITQMYHPDDVGPKNMQP